MRTLVRLTLSLEPAGQLADAEDPAIHKETLTQDVDEFDDHFLARAGRLLAFLKSLQMPGSPDSEGPAGEPPPAACTQCGAPEARATCQFELGGHAGRCGRALCRSCVRRGPTDRDLCASHADLVAREARRSRTRE